MLFAIPLCLIDDFRQSQQWLDRVERLAFVEDVVVTARSAAVNVCDKFAGAPLRHEPRGQLVAPSGYRHDIDAGKLPFEILQQTLIPIDINVDLPFLLSGSEGLRP